MIKTNPDYIQADRLSIVEYYKSLLGNNLLLYSSRFKWWTKTTLFCGLPLAVGSLLIFVAILYQELSLTDNHDWGLIFSCSLMPFIYFLPLIWLITYFHSFIKPGKISTKIERFISTHIPDASEVKPLSNSNYLLKWNDTEFEICYTLIPELDDKGKVIHNHKCFLIALYWMPKKETESQVLDEEGEFQEDFIDEWITYTDNKKGCENLLLENNIMYAWVGEKSKTSNEEICLTMNQMLYLLDRFNLSPLFMIKQMVEESE